jgi:hypothetical protein
MDFPEGGCCACANSGRTIKNASKAAKTAAKLAARFKKARRVGFKRLTQLSLRKLGAFLCASSAFARGNQNHIRKDAGGAKK